MIDDLILLNINVWWLIFDGLMIDWYLIEYFLLIDCGLIADWFIIQDWLIDD